MSALAYSCTTTHTSIQARKILEKMKSAIPLAGKDVSTDEKVDSDTGAWLLSRIDHQLGINYVLTEESSSGLKHLKNAVNFILKTPLLENDHREKTDSVADSSEDISLESRPLREERLDRFGIESIDCLNHLGVLLSNLSQPKLALQYLRLAQRVHTLCMERATHHASDAAAAPASAAAESTEVLPPSPSGDQSVSAATKTALRIQRLGELHTYTLFYLAQVRGR